MFGRAGFDLLDIKPFVKSPPGLKANIDYKFSNATFPGNAWHYPVLFTHITPVSSDTKFVIGLKIGEIESNSTATITVKPENVKNAALTVGDATIYSGEAYYTVTLKLPYVIGDIANRLSLYDGTKEVATFTKFRDDNKTYTATFATSVAGQYKLSVYYLKKPLDTNPSNVLVTTHLS
ncbi:hypothetical protein [Bartonella sp. TP]|uniref:hypothetical protein n=1 Tax=Bartonella sp. TP TaxID=3057550 RepID=UPI0025B0025A|nr:hypothetical protein [Bartonella sp. TP]WJW79669.1 hypothetical protein QVL57_03920 [Bartonella sp. TP]